MAKERTPFQYFVGGAVGGFCVVFVGHPLDTIKVQLQSLPGVYKNMFHVAQSLMATEGPFSLYKGIQAPMATIVPLSAVSFLSYGTGKVLIGRPGQTELDNIQLLLSGAFSGACTTVVTAPGERIKCLLQSPDSKYSGFKDCTQSLWREGGIRSIYLGTCATLLRDMPAFAIYYFAYERIMSILLGPSNKMTWQPLLAGGIAGTTAWIISLPADSIKTRLQIAPMGTYPHGVRSVFPVIMREGGILALYRGMVPVLSWLTILWDLLRKNRLFIGTSFVLSINEYKCSSAFLSIVINVLIFNHGY
ncbi:hypothetical protein KPH14_012344 [Odynerus spinipes]|uniref:Uncharacterized protein n=1 Tax=Odynerus spinipes TaxID=1348599 RepID=A0AAD9RIG5_9HYME|nr:hypothetical protein KPH14_012344 [Odynerus spinipes]